MQIGIMQGRLLPPQGNRIQCFPVVGWHDEFEKAQAAGLSCIEWIYDTPSEAMNPLNDDEGLQALRTLSRKFSIAVRSVCADLFMEQPLLRAEPADFEARHAKLHRLIRQSAKLGVQRMVLPFVDNSAIRTASEAAAVAGMLNALSETAQTEKMELHLETSLNPEEFASLLEQIPSSFVKVNYDSGNSASLGFEPLEEFQAYGERIGSIHIKDRVRGGSTVPLGTGDVDFPMLFSCIEKSGYDGDLILQVARGAAGEEVSWAVSNRQFVERYLAGGPE